MKFGPRPGEAKARPFISRLQPGNTNVSSSIPYWRLSSFYFYYFAALGALAPYWPLYLQAQGFSAAAIGELLAIIAMTRIIAPNVWGWLADHYGRRMPVVRLAGFCAMLGFSGVFFGSDYWWLALSMGLFSFFWNAALPQFEANTLSHLAADSHRYSHIRVWGSIGFILAVMGLGKALESWPVTMVPYAVFGLFAGLWLVSMSVPEYPYAHPHSEHLPLHRILRRPAVAALLSACFLMQAGHSAYYAFYSIYLKDWGYSPTFISVLWSFGVVAEVVLFLFMHRLLQRFGARRLLLASLLLAALRWTVIAHSVESWLILGLVQTLHAASFGIYHAASIHLILRYFHGRHQAKGQALYSSLTFGAGNAVGTLTSGYMWDLWGAVVTFTAASFLCILGFGIGWRWVREDEP